MANSTSNTNKTEASASKNKKPSQTQASKAVSKNVKKPQPSSAAKAKTDAFAKKRMNEKQHSREFLGLLMFLLAFLSILCWFNTDAVILFPLSKLISGLFGQLGRYCMPVILIYCGCILFVSRGAPVRMRIWCSFFSMIFLGGIFHSISDYFGKMDNGLHIPTLWKNGMNWNSGGVIPGYIAELLEICITKVGAIVLMALCLTLFIMATQNITLPSLITEMKKREKPAVKVNPISPSERFLNRITRTPSAEEEKSRRTGNKNLSFDMPLDDPPYVGAKEKLSRPKHLVREVQEAFDEDPAEEIAFHSRKKPAHIPEPVREPEILAMQEPPVVPVDIPVEETEQKPPKVTKEDANAAAASISREIAQNSAETVPYVFPSIDLLNRGKNGSVDATAEMRENSKRLADTLSSFGITPHIVDVIRGPSVTRYELELDPGVKLSKITNLSDDIALALGAQGVRISAIPDKISVVGIEVPNKIVNTVFAKEVIGSSRFNESKSRVSFAVGKDISGNCIVGDIGKMPHMLIAGTTGSGKSVCMNTLIVSLLYKARPDEVKLIMVDPKMVELGVYNGIPHLLIPVVTDPKKAAGALQWTVTEMLRRYRLMSDEHVRDLESYNKAVSSDPSREKLAQIVVVIDELADLMLVAAKEVEESICRIAQMGRAAGIHLVIATQRPSADVITGTMKANIPSRIAFSVSSAMESRIILDATGADKLVGRGDMLFAPHGQGKPQRVQGCFITDDEVSRVVDFIKQNTDSDYSDEVMEQIEKRVEQGNSKQTQEAPPQEEMSDEMLPAAVEVILETGQASVSMLQRRLKLGYARAARIVDEMEERGIVGPFEGAKPRQLLITRDQWEAMKSGVPEAVPDEIL